MARPKAAMKTEALVGAVRTLAANLPKFAQKEAMRHGEYAVKHVQRERFEGYPGYDNEVKSRSHLYMRSRALSRSIRAVEIANNGGVIVEAGRGLKDNRATINEVGAVIKAPPLIPIPLRDALTPTGQRKAAYATVGAALASGARIWKNPKSGEILVRKIRGKGKSKTRPFEYIFVLKSRVVIPPRFRFRETLMKDQFLARDRKVRFTNAVRRAIVSGFGRGGL